MHLFFGDDSRQNFPTRSKMGPLIAAGGFLIDGKAVKSLEASLGDLCQRAGFPINNELKWSPGRELWMRNNLVGDARRHFFFNVLSAAADHDIVAMVVLEDANCRTAPRAQTHEDDVSRLLLERVHNSLPFSSDGCIVIVGRPTGDRADEDRFLSHCLEDLQSGTEYVQHDKIALNVLSTPSKLVRLLQLADLITSCTTARVSGEPRYSPPVFDKVKGLLQNDMSRVGGVGVKIHPDYKYANLYHWILGDTHYWRRNGGVPYPLAGRPYSKDVDLH